MTMLVLGSPTLAADPAAAPFRSITVNGEAQRMVVPDEAHLLVSVSALNPKLQAAKTEHDQKLRKVIGIAKEAGIDEAQIKTQSATIQPQNSYDNGKPQFQGYRVATQLDITVKKPDTIGQLMETLTAAGLENKTDPQWNGLFTVNYTLSNPNALRDELAADAIQNAKLKAERMAGAAGSSIGDAVQITEGAGASFQPIQPRAMMAMAKSMDAAAPPAGEQQVSASVTVTYELK